MKKIFIILVLIFLIASVGFISAADSNDSKTIDIPIKIVWNDSSSVTERPYAVTVDLIKDGTVVDRVILNESNSWKSTFEKVDGEGSYKVVESGLNDYSVSISGNVKNGFVITNSIIKETLGASGDDIVENTYTDDNLTYIDSENIIGNVNTTGDTNTSGDNTTKDNNTNKTHPTNKTTNETNKTIHKNKTIIKKPIPKQPPVKKNDAQRYHMRHTGIPLIALTLVAIVVTIVPFTGKK